MELKINSELKALIPPLTNDEYRLLEESIISEGCRDKLIVWDDTIIDGHNRYEICKKNGIPFQVEDRDFESFDAVKVWMIDNQKGRRNLTDGWKWELAQTRKALLAERGREKQKETLGGYKHTPSVLSKVDKTDSHDTRKELASELGWSTGKVAMADKVWKEADDDIKNKVKSGDLSINQAYTQARKQERQRQHKEISDSNKNIETDKKYRVIYADPPWKYGDTALERTGGAETYYPTMSIFELCEIPIKNISEENSILFLWVTSPLLEECFEVINAWGFKYKTSFVWDKIKHNMGHYNSVRHEFLLVCTRGSCTPDVKKLFDSVQSIERTKHSEKPEEFREIINTIYPNGKRIELFARKKTQGWDVYGNQSV